MIHVRIYVCVHVYVLPLVCLTIGTRKSSSYPHDDSDKNLNHGTVELWPELRLTSSSNET